jgi:hypothetical protein
MLPGFNDSQRPVFIGAQNRDHLLVKASSAQVPHEGFVALPGPPAFTPLFRPQF